MAAPCPLRPRKRTSDRTHEMSAKGQKATNRIAAIDGQFDHLAATILGKWVQPAYPRMKSGEPSLNSTKAILSARALPPMTAQIATALGPALDEPGHFRKSRPPILISAFGGRGDTHRSELAPNDHGSQNARQCVRHRFAPGQQRKRCDANEPSPSINSRVVS